MFNIKKKNSFNYAFEGEKALLQKNYNLALKLYNKAIKNAEEGIEHIDLYYSSRAEIKRHLNDLKGALEDINKAIEIQPNVYLYYFERHEIKNLLNDNEGAEEDLKTVYNILDKNDSSHIFKIYMAEKKAAEGKIQEAAQFLDETDNPKFYNENVLNLKISVHNQLGDKERVIKDLDNLIEIFPFRISYFEYKTNLLIQLNRFDEALTTVNKALQIDNKNGKLYVWRIIINYNLENYEQTQNDINMALSLSLIDDDKKICYDYQSKINEKLG